MNRRDVASWLALATWWLLPFALLALMCAHPAAGPEAKSGPGETAKYEVAPPPTWPVEMDGFVVAAWGSLAGWQVAIDTPKETLTVTLDLDSWLDLHTVGTHVIVTGVRGADGQLTFASVEAAPIYPARTGTGV